jgi:nanoRNase/pAp phosphatase (c-di-AMP/oligoRNAs hydrolase)
MYDDEYDPVGGHTKQEAEFAYRELFKELHGEYPDAAEDSGICSAPSATKYYHLRVDSTEIEKETAKELLIGIIRETEKFQSEQVSAADRQAALALAEIAEADIAALSEEI